MPLRIGVMANYDMESAFKTGAVGDNKTAFNMEQWHGDRIKRILDNTGIDLTTETDPGRVVDAAFWEMQNVPAYEPHYVHMMASPHAEDCAEVFAIYIEGAGAKDASERRGEDALFFTVAITQHAGFFNAPLPPDP